MRIVVMVVSFLLLIGCGNQAHEGMDSTIEYSQFSHTPVTELDAKEMIEFLYRAEKKMREPLENTYVNNEGIEVFSNQFISKSDLFKYYEQYLTIELADTLVRKVTDLSVSRSGEYLAASNYHWYSIYDAVPESIKIIQHTTIQTVVEMDILDELGQGRLQYVIMKNRFGENPKIVQKTLLYN
ncbi:hypothetical protein ACJ2A9_13360 [Anaerobacillus sp. MEB173]|uniref:hypothetical protein n=1 Tax=Anaerobacillus sp. MEB173 TaxID=3383345 RepID=UPI003F91999C